MGKNTGEGQRVGAVVDRVQYFNPKTKMYVKMDTENKKIMSCSKNRYKGVRDKTDDKSEIKPETNLADTKVKSDKSDKTETKTTKTTKTTKPTKTE